MINVRGLQRNVKNVVKNYTEAQVKVREATSNDKVTAVCSSIKRYIQYIVLIYNFLYLISNLFFSLPLD